MPNIEDLLFIQNFMPGYKHHWLYSDQGMPVMITARYDSHEKKSYRQFHLENDEWVEGMPLPPYPLYGLNTLNNDSPFSALLITEGEKCATVIQQLKWPIVSTVLGSQNPSSSDWTPVRYFTYFIILRDNDKAGITFAHKVSTEIYRVCQNPKISVVNLTPDIAGGDLIDLLKKTVLRGSEWNGFDPIPNYMLEAIKKALYEEIRTNSIDVTKCPNVAFNPIEALFEIPPKPLQIELPAVPPFPLDIFPQDIKTYLKLVSDQFSVVPDYAATTLIAVLSGIIGRSVHLRMRPSDSWYETANSWCMLVGPPSAKKSPIMRRIFTLIKPLEKRAAEEFSAANKTYRERKKIAKKNDEDFEELSPILKRFITDDVTTPKLRELMGGNPRGIILRNDELKGQLERLDKMGNEGDRSFMMSCWSGLECYSEDRMCRNSLLNIPLALTWIGCIPPPILQRYLREAMGKGNGADGFMQRFQFVCFPDHKQQFTLPKTVVTETLDNKIQLCIQQLDEDATMQFNRIIHFDEEAQSLFDNWLVEYENDTRFGGHPLYWESHLGKQAKVLAVLIILIHRLNEVVFEKRDDYVSIDTLKAAFKGIKYYQDHASRCYESVSGGSVADAELILNFIKKKRISNRFKAQDIYQQGHGGLDSGRVRAALDLLLDFGWVIRDKVNGGSGRHHEYWIIHPRAFE